MKKVAFLVLSLAFVSMACSKEEETDNNGNNSQAAAGQIKYSLDADAKSGTGLAYSFQDTAYFVKHEANSAQLSLYYNGFAEGTYAIGTSTLDKGKGFITYAPDFVNTPTVIYTSVSGELKLTKIDGKKLTGTFTGTLQKVGSTETIEVKSGTFTSITAQSI